MAIAQIAATFIGFAGVVFAVERASAGGISNPERNSLMSLLVPSIAVLFLAFVPLIASTAIASETLIWRSSNGLLGAIHSVLLAGAVRAALRSQLLEPVPVRFILIGGGFVAVAANAAVVFGFIPELAPTAFLAGLVWFLLISATQFVMLIVLHVRAQ
jgi:hypothetical protein